MSKYLNWILFCIQSFCMGVLLFALILQYTDAPHRISYTGFSYPYCFEFDTDSRLLQYGIISKTDIERLKNPSPCITPINTSISGKVNRSVAVETWGVIVPHRDVYK